MPKTAAEIKLKLRPNSINKTKSQKDIRNFMESQSKKRKLKERMEYLKAKRDNKRIRNQLEKLNNFTSNSSKPRISDKSYNGAVPSHISRKIKKNSKLTSQENSCPRSPALPHTSTAQIPSEEHPYKERGYEEGKGQQNRFKRRENSIDQLKERLQHKVGEIGQVVGQQLLNEKPQKQKSVNSTRRPQAKQL